MYALKHALNALFTTNRMLNSIGWRVCRVVEQCTSAQGKMQEGGSRLRREDVDQTLVYLVYAFCVHCNRERCVPGSFLRQWK